MSQNNNEKNSPQDTIEQLIEEFKRNPNQFLTEADVKSHLYHLLLSVPNFGTLQRGADGNESIPLHTEVRWYRWYEPHRNLNLRSDIVIIDVSTLRTVDGAGFRVPPKGFRAGQIQAIIELKLRRVKGHTDNCFKKDIEKDRNKIFKIQEVLSGGPPPFDFESFLVIFDKKENIGYNEKKKDETRNYTEYYVYTNQQNRG